MTDVRKKFVKFQKPGDFEQRQARVWRILTDVDQSIDLVNIRSESTAYIEEQLEKCQVDM